jgi:hypothetical protein
VTTQIPDQPGRVGSVLDPAGMECGTCGRRMPCVAPQPPLQECAECIRRRRDAIPQLAARFERILLDMVHNERYTGADLYEEALRRTLVVPCGLVLGVDADRTLRAHTIVDKLNVERLERRVAELNQEVRAAIRDGRRQAAEMLRRWCNERTVPSRYRREGVQAAVDALDPPSRQESGR